MYDESLHLITFNIVGADYTKMTDCFGRWSVSFSKDFCKKINNTEEINKMLYSSESGTLHSVLYSVGKVRIQKLIERFSKITKCSKELYDLLDDNKKKNEELEKEIVKLEKMKKKDGKNGTKCNERIKELRINIENQKAQIDSKRKELIHSGVKNEAAIASNKSFYMDLEKKISDFGSLDFLKKHIISVLKDSYKKEKNSKESEKKIFDELIDEIDETIKNEKDINKKIKDEYNEKINKRIFDEIDKRCKNNKTFNNEFIKFYKIKYVSARGIKPIGKIIEIGFPLLKSLPNNNEDTKSLISIYEKKEELFRFIDTLPKFEKTDLEEEIEEFRNSLDINKIVGDIEKEIIDHPMIFIYKSFTEDLDLKNDDELVVGHRDEGELQERQCKLYMDYNNTPRFGNLVGTVRKIYSCKDFSEKILGIKNFRDDKPAGYLNWREKLGDILNRFGEDEKIAVTVRINSRMDINPKKPYFLLEMLSHGNLVLNDYNISMEDTESFLYSCFLLVQMKKHLLKAYQKGAYQTYQTFHDNNLKIKGVIDFGQHIKKNMGLGNGKIAHTYREKSVDNYLNHLILAAYEKLKRDYYSIIARNFDDNYEVRNILNLLRSETEFPKFSNSFLIRKCESPISHPYYTEYEDLRKICLSILRNESSTIMPGKGDDCDGILYYVPDLWEEYLEMKMIEKLRLEAQKEILYFGDENGTSFNSLSYPDFVFENDQGRPCMILDAKYKPGWKTIHDKGKITSYYREDYNKCIRDMNSLLAFATGVIFPYISGVADEQILETNEENDTITNDSVNSSNEGIKKHSISKYNNISVFYSIPISIKEVRLSEGFDEWQENMNKHVEKQVEALGKILEEEGVRFSKIRNAIDTIDKEKNITLFDLSI